MQIQDRRGYDERDGHRHRDVHTCVNPEGACANPDGPSVTPESPSVNTKPREPAPDSCQQFNPRARRSDEAGDDSGSDQTDQREEQRRQRLA